MALARGEWNVSRLAQEIPAAVMDGWVAYFAWEARDRLRDLEFVHGVSTATLMGPHLKRGTQLSPADIFPALDEARAKAPRGLRSLVDSLRAAGVQVISRRRPADQG